MTKTIVFTATYNEKDNIENFTSKIFEIDNSIKVLVIDDNSPE